MVNAVSNVSANNNLKATDKVSQEKLYSPGAYSMNPIYQTQAYGYKKKGSFLGFLFKIGLTAAAIGGVAAFARKRPSFKDFPVDAKPEKLVEQAKYYFAKLGDFVNKKVIDKIIDKLPKKVADATPKE